MSLKIKLEETDGQKHLNPETMELLAAFGQHRQFCGDCERASKDSSLQPCSFGADLIRKLLERPDVEQVRD